MDSKKQDTAIWWIRRDLRLHDNQALTAALHNHETIIPVFILDDQLLRNSNPRRTDFLIENLKSLDKVLHERGSRLILNRGEPLACLQKIFHAHGITAIYAEADHTPYALARDERVANHLPLTLTAGVSILPPNQIHKKDGDPYTVFTPFARRWKERVMLADIFHAPRRLSTPGAELGSETFPDSSPSKLFPAGETVAQERLSHFLNNCIVSYHKERDLLAQDGTSMLSPYLHFGILSIRDVFQQAFLLQQAKQDADQRAGIDSWINELIWREFYMTILAKFPHVRHHPFRLDYEQIPWLEDERNFKAWKEGKTGFPLVDAGMRQLQKTGWMHNRARMVVASFLCKDLLINWQWGEKWFMQNLLDADVAANNGGWQWSAGTGTDAAPYFRIFNPVSQSKKFDAQGTYIYRWVDELANVPLKYIHTPWEMPPDIQNTSNCRIGQDYPQRIVDHARVRERALQTYKQAKSTNRN
ncbi:MAG: deoxyribodipyrimidine photo-lyase [Chloroflexi bacterium]|nr:deoxyribodipyrimidine photo-lyase [Chloroflexota bacterium]